MTGRLRDKKGIPIMPGDLIKVYHFTGARKKKHYMYKIVWVLENKLYAAHCSGIEQKGLTLENSYFLSEESLGSCEILEGFCGGRSFDERDRV